MRSLDGLELGNILLLFTRIAVGMILQGEFAVLLLYIFTRGSGGELEVSICRQG